MKVYEALGLGAAEAKFGVQFGIECETEGRRLPNILTPFWNTEQDGSLRGGLEYVSKPLSAESVKPALSALFKEIKDEKGIPEYSFRCSTHIHVNVQDLDQEELFTMIFLYMMYENVFMNYVDAERVGNRFCLRFQDAGALITEFTKLVKNTRSYGLARAIRNLNQNTLKYAALNMYTLVTYGTLEFRALEGTNNVDKIHNWVIAIEKLRALSVALKTPQDAYAAFLHDPSGLAENIFGHASASFLKEGWHEQVEEAYSQSQAVLGYF